jgi:hypothetical protein
VSFFQPYELYFVRFIHIRSFDSFILLVLYPSFLFLFLFLFCFVVFYCTHLNDASLAVFLFAVVNGIILRFCHQERTLET